MSYECNEINGVRILNLTKLNPKEFEFIKNIPAKHSIPTEVGCFRKCSIPNLNDPGRASFMMVAEEHQEKWEKVKSALIGVLTIN
ncbi:hypothetical protein G6703_02165 [Polynucleobacter paneuropaeus]|nr:hypothetical protein G6703_02165 [Polynucleobacter paneuropaeus]